MERTLTGTGYLLLDLMHNTRQKVFGSTVVSSFAYTSFGQELYSSTTNVSPYYRYQGWGVAIQGCFELCLCDE